MRWFVAHARVTVWLVVVLEYILVAGCASGALIELAGAPPGRCGGDICLGNAAPALALAILTASTLLTGLVAAPLVDARMRRQRRLHSRPDPADLRGLARTATTTAAYGILWGMLAAPIVACLTAAAILKLV